MRIPHFCIKSRETHSFHADCKKKREHEKSIRKQKKKSKIAPSQVCNCTFYISIDYHELSALKLVFDLRLVGFQKKNYNDFHRQLVLHFTVLKPPRLLLLSSTHL